MDDLTLVTCQAHNTVAISRALAGVLGRPLRYLEDADWQDSYRRIAAGEIAVGWICGRPYVRLADEGAPIHLLAAPVMAGERYGGRPVYFSDVVVRRDSPYTTFAELRGATWAYNEPGSQSGYHVTRYHLARLGVKPGESFFGRSQATGAHLNSLAMVLSGAADASAIDSTVLEWELAADPGLAEHIRVIDAIGPSPVPPLVVSTRVPDDVTAEWRRRLLALHQTEAGRQALAVGRLARFAAVTDADYDPIRAMERAAEGILL
jgi:phosphonate transport system substrate-binding protein